LSLTECPRYVIIAVPNRHNVLSFLSLTSNFIFQTTRIVYMGGSATFFLLRTRKICLKYGSTFV
jgi:hypothetical protein